MNGISPQVRIGTLGELLIQTRLLQFGVQAAPPLKDSGNDLIAIRGQTFRATQVKTRTKDSFTLGNFPPLYDILALVQLIGEGDTTYLDRSGVYLMPRSVVESRDIRSFAGLDEFLLRSEWVSELFT